MQPLFTIAEKEFRDHLTSKRFIIILAVLLLLAAYAMATGMDQYNQRLDAYKNMKATGAPGYHDPSGYNPFVGSYMPSVLEVFQSFTILFAFMGILLGLAMGSDQLTKEKESGALKSVLLAPVYRDTLINGKTLGSIATLAVAIGSTFLVVIAIMLLYGVVPGLEELARIFLFFIVSLVYCTAFFAIAMATSALAKNSAMAIISALGIVFVLIILAFLSAIISSAATDLIVGPEPAYQAPAVYTASAPDNSTVYTMTRSGNGTSYTMVSGGNGSAGNGTGPGEMPAPVVSYSNDYENNYFTKKDRVRSQIYDALNTVSPFFDFMTFDMKHPGAAQALLSKDKITDSSFDMFYMYGMQTQQQASLGDSLSYIWVKLLVLAVEAIVAFAVSYAVFLRMDVR